MAHSLEARRLQPTEAVQKQMISELGRQMTDQVVGFEMSHLLRIGIRGSSFEFDHYFFYYQLRKQTKYLVESKLQL